MAQFMKKGITGLKISEKGYKDPEWSVVQLSREEYKDLQENLYSTRLKCGAVERKLEEAEQKLAKADESEKMRTERIKSSLEWYENRCEELENEVNNLSEENEALNEKMDGLTARAENLLRINREYANSKRQLTPKKEHSGYVIKRSTLKEILDRSSGMTKKEFFWETIIETPYSVEFHFEDAKKLIGELFGGEDIENRWLISDLGIGYLYFSMEAYKDARIKGKHNEETNSVVKVGYTANCKSGFWEIQILHTKPLDAFPWNWREKEDK